MILLAGIASETALALVRGHLEEMGAPFVLFHQRTFESVEIDLEIRGGAVGGRLRVNGHPHRLEDFSAVYTRMMDDRFLPEVRDEPPESPRRRRCRAVHDALMRWWEVAPGRIVNRMAPMGSNGSKPYQAQLLLEQGFRVPETLVTNDPQEVLAFRARHGRVIYKSMSGVRSIVQTLTDADLPRLERIRWCPVQFQEFVPGTNVRVHAIGDRVIATAAETEATDYRYAHRQVGKPVEMEAVLISDRLAERCVRLAAALGLAFAGIDLKITPDGEVYCFEVNPTPAFSYYEQQTGQPIALTVARYLAAA